MPLLLAVPGAAVPGALIPGYADPGYDGASHDVYVTVAGAQAVTGQKTFTALGSYGGGHWEGAVITDDITVVPNSAISTSASMFLDNLNGQVWEFFSDVAGDFGVYDKTNTSWAFTIHNAAAGYLTKTYGSLYSVNNTLDDGTGKLTTTNDIHCGEWIYAAGNVVGSGGYAAAVVTVTSNYTISSSFSTDSTILCNGATAVAMPTIGSVPAGRMFTIKQIHSTGSVSVTSSGATIDGASSYLLSAQYKYVTVQSDGSNWFVIASN